MMIRKIVSCILFCHLTAASIYADWTITTPAEINISSVVYNNVSCSFNPVTGYSLAVWAANDAGHAPMYSFYIPGTGWTAPAVISESTSVVGDIFSACDPSTGLIIATWKDSNNLYPTYSIYTPGSGWSIIDTITTSLPVNNGTFFDVFVSFNSATGQFLATWTGTSDDPTYAFYTPGTGWGVASTIPGTSSVEGNVFSVGNSIVGTSMAAWSDLETNYPTYSIYTPGTGWTTSTTITTSAYMFEDVYLSFDSTTGQTLATWGDSQNNFAPTYSFYTPGTGWSAINPLPGSTEVFEDVITSFDPVTGQFLAIWADSNNANKITYSFYTPGTGWGFPALLSVSPVADAKTNVYLAYDSLTGQILATWTGGIIEGLLPFYSFFDGPAPPPPPPPNPSAPASFSGKVTNTVFLTQTDRINKLNWTPASDPTIVSYLLRRNGVLIYTAPSSGPYTYEDHNRNKKVSYVYTLTSINQRGLESSALTVIIN